MLIAIFPLLLQIVILTISKQDIIPQEEQIDKLGDYDASMNDIAKLWREISLVPIKSAETAGYINRIVL